MQIKAINIFLSFQVAKLINTPISVNIKENDHDVKHS